MYLINGLPAFMLLAATVVHEVRQQGQSKKQDSTVDNVL